MSKILSVIDLAVETNQLSNLTIDRNGDLVVGNPSFYDKFSSFFGNGNYSSDKIAHFLDDHADQMKQESFEFLSQHKSIISTNDAINYIFKHSSIGDKAIDLNSHLYSNWMDHLADSAKDQPLKTILCPGTHDSAAHSVDWSHAIKSEGANPYINTASKVLNYLPGINNLVEHWTVTQSESITQQLEHGVRYFDLRMAQNADDGKLYVSHTFAVDKLDSVIKEFADFSNNHPNEVLVIAMKPDWEYRANYYSWKGDVNNLVHNAFGHHIAKEFDANSTTYNDLIKSHQNIILASDDYNGMFSNDQVHLNTLWHNEDTVSKQINDSINYIQQHHYGLAGDFFTVTASKDTMLHNYSIKGVADDLNSHIYDLIDAYKSSHGSYGDLSHISLDNPSLEHLEAIIHYNNFA